MIQRKITWEILQWTSDLFTMSETSSQVWGTDPKYLEPRIILTALANDLLHSILQYLQFLFSSPLQHTRQPTALNHWALPWYIYMSRARRTLLSAEGMQLAVLLLQRTAGFYLMIIINKEAKKQKHLDHFPVVRRWFHRDLQMSRRPLFHSRYLSNLRMWHALYLHLLHCR